MASGAIRRSLARFIVLNGVMLCAFGVSRLLPFTAPVLGVPLVLFPGFLLALFLEQLTGRRESPAALGLWSVVFGVSVVPAGVYAAETFLAVTPMVAFAMAWAVSAGLAVAALAWYKLVPGYEAAAWSSWRGFVGPCALALALVAVNLLLYRFIPEADGYSYLISLRAMAQDPVAVARDTRPVFLAAMQLWSAMLRLDPYWLFKAVMPLFGAAVTAAAVWSVAARSGLTRRAALLAVLLPFSLPVFLQELLITRPQTLVILALLPALYLLGRSDREPRVPDAYQGLALMVAGIAGLRIHTLSAVLVVLGTIGTVRSLWPLIRRRPFDAACATAGLCLVALGSPWFSRIAADAGHVLSQLGHTFAAARFDPWFIDRYTNVDGNEVGWPGWSAALYYGYNLGLLLPALLAYRIWSRRTAQSRAPVWPAAVLAGGFLCVAEVLPRFGYAYLPDRAWLFVGVAVAVLAPSWLAAIDSSVSRPLWRIAGVLAVASLVAASGVTYAKQGWVSDAEYRAVPFLRDTPSDAQFVGQGSARIAVRYFADRTFLGLPSNVWTSDDPNAVAAYLDQSAADEQSVAAEQVRRRAEAAATVAALFDRYAAAPLPDTRAAVLRDAQRLLEAAASSEAADVRYEASDRYDPAAPVYLLYDTGKFRSLYGQRAWWRASNGYGADLAAFDARYQIVYRQDGLTVWKVR